MEPILSLLKINNYDPWLIATVAVAEHIGGNDTLEMLKMRHRGASLQDIADMFGMSKPGIAKRLEVAEAKRDALQKRMDEALAGKATVAVR